MGGTYSSKMHVFIYQATWHHIPEDWNLRWHCARISMHFLVNVYNFSSTSVLYLQDMICFLIKASFCLFCVLFLAGCTIITVMLIAQLLTQHLRLCTFWPLHFKAKTKGCWNHDTGILVELLQMLPQAIYQSGYKNMECESVINYKIQQNPWHF